MIIVTGAAGFIGSVVVAGLNARGEKDLVLVDTLGSEGKFKNLRAKSYVDIVSPAELLASLGAKKLKPSVIVHMGAITDTADKDADSMLASNYRYTRALAEYCLSNNVRFVYASSAAVYGDGALGFADDDDLTPSLLPLNPYAYSKWLFDTEAIRRGWTTLIAGLRFYNVFGPNEYHKGFMASVVWHSHAKAQESGKIRLFESHRDGIAHGEQKRDFVYVKDVVDAVIWFALESKANGIFNLGSGTARSYNDLAKAIFSAMGQAANIEYMPTPESIRASYQYYTQADLSRLRSAGYSKPFPSLEETIADYVGGYLLTANPYL